VFVKNDGGVIVYVKKYSDMRHRREKLPIDGDCASACTTVCTENLIRVDAVTESPKLAE
jgi:hypothetical protein